ncbi:MAG: fibronectin type III domain-containing protein, partial [bacterium]|nr:fibronectin type III domain-containing protein [bacterium]
MAEGATLDYETDDAHRETESWNGEVIAKFYRGEVHYTVDGHNVVISVSLKVTDVAPGKPGAPTVTRTAFSEPSDPALDVSWTAAAANGTTITGYEAQYRKKAAQGEEAADWTAYSGTLGATATSLTLTSLEAGATYEVQVRAVSSDESAGAWSDTGSGRANHPPAATSVAFNGGTFPVGSIADYDESNPLVGAFFEDADGDTLTYSAAAQYPGLLGVSLSGASGGALLRVTLLNPGASGVTYTAADAYGGSVSRTVTLTGTANETRTVAENSAGGTAVGDPVTGTPYDDGDEETDDALSYSLTGEAATTGAFEIDAATGQISVKEGASLDYEAKTSYTGKVHWTVQGQAAVVNLTINLTDITGPETPAAPDAEAGETEPATTLDVDWTAPDDLGSPITGYRVQYRAAGPNDWTAHAFSGTGTETTITGLTSASIYEVQVLAVNGEGESDWSATGTGLTGPRQVSAQRSLPENAQPGTLVGDPVAVTAPGGLTLSYSVVPTITEPNGNNAQSTSETEESGKFVVDSASGQIRLARGASLDYETARSHSLTLRATHSLAGYDGRIVHTVISVVIDVTDVDESSPTPPPPVTPIPELTLESGAREVAENSPGGTHVGAAVAAQGGDGEPLTYAISGDAAFTIDAATGQISVADGAGPFLDHESTPSYTVTVSVSDGKDTDGEADPSVDASADFTISVTDVDEPPPTPDAPWVTRSPVDPDTDLDVSWVAALVSGAPETTDYDVRYRAEGASEWTSHPFDGVIPSTTLTGLEPGTTYEVQV